MDPNTYVSCRVQNIGSGNIAVALTYVNDPEGDPYTNNSRLFLFNLKGNLFQTILGQNDGWEEPYLTSSSSGSFGLYGYNGMYQSSYKFYVYDKRSKLWMAHPNLGMNNVATSTEAGGSTPFALWAEIKDESGKLVIYVYRF